MLKSNRFSLSFFAFCLLVFTNLHVKPTPPTMKKPHRKQWVGTLFFVSTLVCSLACAGQIQHQNVHIREVLFGNQAGVEHIRIEAPLTGTGNTSGDIATLHLRNLSDEGITLLVNPFFLPPTAGYQPYVAPGGESVYIPPRNRMPTPAERAGNQPGHISYPAPGEAIVPIQGFCTDIRKPPIPKGVSASLPLPRPPTGSSPESTLLMLQEYMESRPHLFPHPRATVENAPFPAYWELLEEVNRLVSQAQRAITPQTQPVSRLFLESRPEELVQQGYWYVLESMAGRTYSEPVFREKIHEQFSRMLDMPLEEAAEEVQESVAAGTAELWEMISLTGETAKLNAPAYHETEQFRHEASAPSCIIDAQITVNPPYDLSLVISDAWANVEEKETRAKKFRASLEGFISKLDGEMEEEAWAAEYAVLDTPLSAHVFWVPEVVGGQVNAYAWTLMTRVNDPSKFIWDTEELLAETSESKRILNVTARADEDCTTHVIIVSASRVEALSYAFDPVAKHADILRPVAFIGNLAVEFLLLKVKGGARGTASLKSFLIGKVKDAALEELEKRLDALEQELRKTASAYINEHADRVPAEGLDVIDWLLEESLRNPGEASLNRAREKLIDELSKMLGIDVGDGVENLEWLLEQLGKSPKDIILDNLPDLDMAQLSRASAYAMSEGKISHKVGVNEGHAHARSHVRYERDRLEDDAITGGGLHVSDVVVSDRAPGSLRAICEASAKTGGQASGNGHAKATLDSFTATVAIGVCYCPDDVFFDMFTTFSYTDRDKFGHLGRDFQQMAEKKLKEMFDEADVPDPSAIELRMARHVRQWMEENK